MSLPKDLQERIDKLQNIQKPGTDTIERGKVQTIEIDTEKKEFPKEWLEKVEYPEILEAFIEALTKLPSIRRRLIMSSFVKLAKNWLIERIKEPSSYNGLVLLAAGVGITISQEMAIQILALAGSLVGFIEFVKNERKKKEE